MSSPNGDCLPGDLNIVMVTVYEFLLEFPGGCVTQFANHIKHELPKIIHANSPP